MLQCFLYTSCSSIYIFLASLLSRLTVLGYLSILEPVLWQMVPSLSPFFCRRWLHLHQAVMENPCLVPTWTPVRRRRMNAAYSSWKSLPDVISGLDAGHSWAMVSLPFCLSRGIFVRVKNVRPVKTLASMRGGGIGAGQTSNQSFTSPFSFQVIKYWGTDNKMPGHSNSCQTIGSKLI